MFWHCRLCAELKSSEFVLDLESDEEKYADLLVKLRFLNAKYVNLNISDRISLPRIICFSCHESLSKAYEFLLKVRKAQKVLFPEMDVTKTELLEDDLDSKLRRLLEGVKEEKKTLDNKEGNQKERRPPVTQIVCEVDPTQCNIGVPNIKQETLPEIASTSQSWCPTLRKCLAEDKIQSWKEIQWTCGICYVKQKDIDTLRSHSIKEHKKCAEFACYICEKAFNFNSFVTHTRNDHALLRNRCHYCNAKTELEELPAHINQHLDSAQPCPNCGEIFPDETKLKSHLDSTRKKRKNRKVKYTEQDRTCPICHKVSWCFSKLRDHMKIHTGDRQRDYVCDLCGKMFYSKGSLKCHLISHSSERPHVCQECNASFKKLFNLQQHVKTHSSVKPFTCATCGRSFFHKDALKKHEVVHTDTFPFFCQYCNKGFNFKTCLTKHERQHTGVKPYSCEECSRAFTDWGNFNKHMKRRHNRDMSKKKMLPGKYVNQTEFNPLQ